MLINKEKKTNKQTKNKIKYELAPENNTKNWIKQQGGNPFDGTDFNSSINESFR